MKVETSDFFDHILFVLRNIERLQFFEFRTYLVAGPQNSVMSVRLLGDILEVCHARKKSNLSQ